ncbi:MAG: glycosyltransferase family 39 protein [Rhodobacteraceae bacterium]|nr:glycosyltransferase family 39 protein [Paracoccaceae bacterium]
MIDKRDATNETDAEQEPSSDRRAQTETADIEAVLQGGDAPHVDQDSPNIEENPAVGHVEDGDATGAEAAEEAVAAGADRDAQAPGHTDQPAAAAAEISKPLWLKLFGHDLSAPLLLLALALALFVPGQWTVPPLDRDEPRYTQATKQMLETGDYVDIRFQDQARHKKPVGIYWLQVASIKLTGHDATAPLWVYRLPSLIGGILVVLGSYWMARAFTGPPGALLTALFVAGAIIVGVESRLAKTDSMLFASIVWSQGALARVWLANQSKRRWGLAFVFWFGLAVGTLVKGPVAPMIIGLTIVALVILSRRVKWFVSLAPLVGVLLFAAIVLPWFIAIYFATDGSFFHEAIGKDLLGKVAEGQENHGAPPLTHLAVMFAIFWPLPAFFLATLGRIWTDRKTERVVFALSWFVPTWIVFELVATKLPHYTLPLLPALGLMVGAALLEPREGPGKRGLNWVSALLVAVPAVALFAASFVGPLLLGDWPSPPGVVFCGLAAVLSLFAARQFLNGAELRALPMSIAAAIMVAFGFWGFVGPSLSAIWVSPRLVAAIDSTAPCSDPKVVTVGFHEPSFVFLNGTDTQLSSSGGAAAFLAEPGAVAAQGCHVAIIESRHEDAFLESAQNSGLVPSLLGRVKGLNINGGKELDIGVYSADTGVLSSQ